MRGISLYRAVFHHSAEPEQLVMKLHERVVVDLERALDAGDPRDADEHLDNADQIFALLTRTLDRRVDPELADGLETLFTWAREEIAAGDRGAIEQVLAMAAQLEEAWKDTLG